MPTCGESAIALLEELGVEVVFGIPGVHTLEFYRGLNESRIRHVTPRHEQGAAFMATGYGMVSARPGVCVLITGAGLTNAATGVASAYHDSQPLLVLSSATDSADAGRDRGALHDLPDQQGLMQTITAFSQTVSDPQELPGALRRAFDSFASGRPRPVHVGVPVDVLARDGAASGLPPSAAARPALDADAVSRAASLLQHASSPFILLGGGAADAGPESVRLAELTGAPIATTTNGKGAVPESHPATLGATVTLEPTWSQIVEADVLLAVGTEFSEVDYYYAPGIPKPRGQVIRVDIDEAQLGNGASAAIGICGDASAALAAIAEVLERGGATPSGAGHARVSELRSQIRWHEGAEAYRPVLDAINEALPGDAIVASDSTQIAYVGNNYLRVEAPRSYLCPAGFGTLGPALPMAIGAQVAAPERPVVCLTGDGGLLFTIAELATAAQLGLPLVVLLWQNQGYGEIRDAMAGANIPPIGTDTTAHDYAQLARGFGCNAVQPGSLDGIGPAIAEALTADRPTVIELVAGELR